jgi:hypothetical protein
MGGRGEPIDDNSLGAQREAIDEPIVFALMPAASVFFDDPDGNLLGAPSAVVGFSPSLREVGIS